MFFHGEKFIMTAPIASIIVSLVITFGFLFGSGAFTPTPHSYATVSFDGGYQKIGVINREEIYTEARIEINGDKLVSGDFSEVIAWIQRSPRDNDTIESLTWKNGVRVKASAGIRWIGSESSFKLATDTLDVKSTTQAPLKPAEVITQLNELEKKAKDARKENANKALSLGPTPTESFLISKILAAFQK
jgi:hypothetical protein